MAARKARDGQGTIRKVWSKTKGWRHEAAVSVTDVRSGISTRPTKTFNTEKEAQAWIDKTKQDAARGVVTNGKVVTAAQVVKAWLELESGDKVGSTMQNYWSNYRRHFPSKLNVRADRLTETRVRQFVREVGASASGDGRATARTSFNMLRTAMKWASRREVNLVPFNPIPHIRFEYSTREVTREAMPHEEARLMLDVSAGKTSGLIWRLMIETGARKGELLGLNVGDVDFRPAGTRIWIAKIATMESHGTELAERTKGKSKRWIDLTPELAAALQAHVAGRGSGGPLFPAILPTSRTGRLGFGTVDRWWHRDLEEAGLKGRNYVPHQLRHTFASYLLGENVAPNVVSEILGHSSTVTTMRFYAHATADQKRAATDVVRSLTSRSVVGNFVGKSTTQPSAGSAGEAGGARIPLSTRKSG